MRILVIEDEPRLAENIAAALREGPRYAVDVAHDGEEAMLLGSAHMYDGLVLDLMLPKRSGRDVLKCLRACGVSTPVLVLTAVSETSRVIELLNLGADDYMTKPFDLGELIARLRALIRRSAGQAERTLQRGSLVMHMDEHRLRVNGTLVELTPTEHRIVEYMLHRPRVIVSQQELLEHLFDFTWKAHSNVIEVHISNLRRKLRLAGSKTTLATIRGRGYRWNDRC